MFLWRRTERNHKAIRRKDGRKRVGKPKSRRERKTMRIMEEKSNSLEKVRKKEMKYRRTSIRKKRKMKKKKQKKETE